MVTKANGSVAPIPTDPTTKLATTPGSLSIPVGSGIGLAGGTPGANTIDMGSSTVGILSVTGTILAKLTAAFVQFLVPIQIQNTQCGLYAGAGNPNGIVTAPPGSVYLNNAGGAVTTLWVKETGIANTGWVAK